MPSRSGRPIRAVEANGQHTVAINTEDISVTMGVCGLGSSASATAQLARQAMLRCKQVSNPLLSCVTCGWTHNLGISASGSLFAWGCGIYARSSASDGCIPALGTLNGRAPKSEATVPTEVFAPSLASGVADVAAGFAHSAALTKDVVPRVVTFGANDRSQLARSVSGAETDSNGSAVDSQPVVAEVNTGRHGRPTSVAAGYNHTLVTTSSGVLLCAGDNSAAQCGDPLPTANAFSIFEKMLPIAIRQQGEHNSRAQTSASSDDAASSIETDIVSRFKRIAEVHNEHVDGADGGYCSTVLRCRSGKVYSLGCGHNGERGDGSDGSASTLSEVPLPDNLKASKINVGNSHALCLTDSGEVYGWGGMMQSPCFRCNGYEDAALMLSADNTFGQLGLGSPDYVFKPVKIFDKAIDIAAGDTHSAILRSNGTLHTSGDGRWGQLGSQDDQCRTKFKQMLCQTYD